MTLLRQVALLFVLASCLATGCRRPIAESDTSTPPSRLGADPQPDHIVGHRQSRLYGLQAPAGPGRVYLLVAGRIQWDSEYDPLHAIGLAFNDAPLTPALLVGPVHPYNSVLNGLFRTWPIHLYNSDSRLWAFKRDTDWTANNGPPNGRGTQPGYCLAFDVTHLVRKGDNQLLVTNTLGQSRSMPKKGLFMVRHIGLGHAWRDRFERLNRFARPYTERIVPQWTYFHYHNPMLPAWYLDRFKDDPVRTAELKLQLALLDLFKGNQEKYIQLLDESLAAAPDFPNREVVRYALTVEDRPVPPVGKLAGWDRDLLHTVFQHGSPTLWNRRVRTLRYVREGGRFGAELMPILRVSRTDKAITVDGIDGDPGWADGLTAMVDRPIGNRSVPPTLSGARVTAVADDEALYLKFTGKLGPNPVGPVGTGEGAPVWNTNAIEVFVSPQLRPADYWEINADVYGKGHIAKVSRYPRHDLARLRRVDDLPIERTTAARTTGGSFVVEYRIPFATMQTGSPKPGEVWALSLVFLQWDRLEGRKVGRASFFSPMPYYDFHVWPAFGFMVFK